MGLYTKPYKPNDGDTIFASHINNEIEATNTFSDLQAAKDAEQDATIGNVVNDVQDNVDLAASYASGALPLGEPVGGSASANRVIAEAQADLSAQYASGVGGEPVGGSSSANRVLAESAVVDCQAEVTNCQTEVTNCQTQVTLANTARTGSETAQGLSEDARDESIQYAIGEPTEPTEYSAKYWALQSKVGPNPNLLVNSDFSNNWNYGIADVTVTMATVGQAIAPGWISNSTTGTLAINRNNPEDVWMTLTNGSILQDITKFLSINGGITNPSFPITVSVEVLQGTLVINTHSFTSGRSSYTFDFDFESSPYPFVISSTGSACVFKNLKLECGDTETTYISPLYDMANEMTKVYVYETI